MWFNLGETHGDDENFGLPSLAKGGIEKLEKQMTASQIAEAQRRAREWKPKIEK